MACIVAKYDMNWHWAINMTAMAAFRGRMAGSEEIGDNCSSSDGDEQAQQSDLDFVEDNRAESNSEAEYENDEAEHSPFPGIADLGPKWMPRSITSAFHAGKVLIRKASMKMESGGAGTSGKKRMQESQVGVSRSSSNWWLIRVKSSWSVKVKLECQGEVGAW